MVLNDFFSTYKPLSTSEPPIVTQEVRQAQKSYMELMAPMYDVRERISETMPTSLLTDGWANDYFDLSNLNIFDEEEQPVEEQDSQSTSPNAAQKAVDLALTFVGSKYTWGGHSPKTGFDCSGLGYYSYGQMGVKLPRTAAQIAKVGREVPIDKVEKGDVIVTKSRGPSGHHIVYVVKRDPQTGEITVVEAKGKKYGVVISKFTNFKNVIAVRRLVENSTKNVQKGNVASQYPSVSNHRFTDKRLFISTLNTAYRKALQEFGKNPNLAMMITCQDALESGYGAKVQGNFNYGNISTLRKGDYHITSNIGLHWKDFSSIKDYVKYKVEYLDRKYKFFDFADPNNVAGTMQKLADMGYCPGSPSYGSKIAQVYNFVLKKYV